MPSRQQVKIHTNRRSPRSCDGAKAGQIALAIGELADMSKTLKLKRVSATGRAFVQR
jgi:hypothetical protein